MLDPRGKLAADEAGRSFVALAARPRGPRREKAGRPSPGPRPARLVRAGRARRACCPLLFEQDEDARRSCGRRCGATAPSTAPPPPSGAAARKPWPTSCAGPGAASPLVLLKGADYCGGCTRGPELRPMDDIDVLVPRERMDAGVRAPRGSGLRAVPPAAAVARAGLVSRARDAAGAGRGRGPPQLRPARAPSDRLPGALVAPRPRRRGSARRLPARRRRRSRLSRALAGDRRVRVPLVRYLDLWLLLGRAPRAWPRRSGARAAGAPRARSTARCASSSACCPNRAARPERRCRAG